MRPDDRTRAGALGEALAYGYLTARGWRVRARGLRTKLAQIDLVCEDGGTVVFVEVKLRRSAAFGHAAEGVRPRQRARLRQAAAMYMKALPGRPWRIDLVAITLESGTPRIELMRGAL